MRHLRTELISILDQAKAVCREVLPEATLLQRDLEIRKLFTEYQPALMFYGHYNAGKSTLLNALLSKDGVEVAPTSDRPCTAEITPYNFGEYIVYDTPGLDAPAEHERISRAQLEKTHVVVFVTSTAGSFDEGSTTEELKRVLESGRELIVVLNNKTGSMPGAEEVAGTRRKLLDNLAQATGDETVVSKVEVLVVNALTAQKARKTAQEGEKEKADVLLEHSGIKLLEDAMLRALTRSHGDKLLLPAVLMLEQSLAQTIVELNHAQSDDAQVYSALHSSIIDARTRFIESASAEVKTLLGGLVGDLVMAFQQPEENVNTLTPFFESYLENVADVVDTSLKKTLGTLETAFEDIAANASTQEWSFSYRPPSYQAAGGGVEANFEAKGDLKIDPKVVGDFANSPQGQEFIKKGLLQLRKWKIPGFKGRWERTLGKWAGSIGKAASIGVPVAFAAYDMYKAKKAQDEFNQREKLRHEQMHVNARQLALAVERDVMKEVVDAGKEAFAGLESEFKQEASNASAQDKQRLLAIDKLSALRTELVEIRTDVFNPTRN